ncbi:pilin [Francisella sciaenopsi]|uniref:Pilin n=1 Tax=Francisella sciaenopsi TaxID=3055034 RepID=A0ABQ6PEZ2_9GAMM
MKKKMQKGFSLVELMVVIAIIAILAAVAIPMYSNYTTRAKVSSEISEMGGAKADAAERIANTNPTSGSTIAITAQSAGTGGLAPDTQILDNGTVQKSSTALSGSNIQLVPAATSGSIQWTCKITGSPSTSSIPSNCSSIA